MTVLNADGEWVSYDEATNTATISSVSAFVTALKRAAKSLGAFGPARPRAGREHYLWRRWIGELAHAG